jgi:uncharacterized repeat protein (TIGR01451 family)
VKLGFTTLHLHCAVTGAMSGAMFVFAAVFGLGASTWAATPANMAITNTATANYSVDANNFSITSTATLNTAACAAAGLKIELLQYVSASSAALAPAGTRMETVQPTGYAPHGALTGPFVALGQLTLPGQSASTSLPASLLLAPLNDAMGKPIGTYSRNEPIFVRVVSYDANLNSAVADTVSVTLTTSGGDSEVLQLTETGSASGVFVGAKPSVFAAIGTLPTLNDGKITISSHNQSISAAYKHSDCSSGVAITSSSSGLIDPYGIVFNSATGAPVNGAKVSKISLLTGQLASIYCEDAVTVMPQPITSGAPTICDAVVAPGSYHFPLAPTGNYRLVVTPPPGYNFPSTVPATALPVMIGLPPVASVILGNPGQTPGASYGGVFSLWGPSLRVDLPLDSASTSLTLSKSADKTVVAIGEFVAYTVTVANNSATKALTGGLLADHPPPGFRYRRGSARLNGLPIVDPVVAPDALTLGFTVNIPADTLVTLRYVLEVTAAAHEGAADNSVTAGGGISSNTARASVLVRDDLFRNKAILIGRVIDASCDDKAVLHAKGLANARVVLQNGSYVLTDKEGSWHIDNLGAGTHVVQLDLDSLPKDYEVLDCHSNNRFAGRAYSQFVNLRAGTLWRADFHVQRKPVSAASSAEAQATVSAASPVATRVDDDPTRLMESLPYDQLWLATALPGNEWLHPQESFHPNLSVIKVAVKHDPSHKLVLIVNGDAVSPLLFEGTQTSLARKMALSSWNAVPLKEGSNRVELVISDAQGQEVSRTVRNIHYAATPDHLEFVPQQSRLIADGKTRPVIAIRFLDKSGVPVRRGVSGEFQLNEPYLSRDRLEGIELQPLTGTVTDKPRFDIKNDGVALIELEPTTQSGEAILNFQFNDQRKQEVRAWLQAGQRDWILVGFAEGTAGHKTLSGNLQALQAADAANQLFDGNQLAFYAKGTIRGDYLLTVAYDTTKQTGNTLLKQAIDPTQYYTLYADASQSRFDAASTSRLYLKIERRQFYAMFGDYDTSLSVTELSRYSRTLSGVKSEYKGERFGYNAFASVTAQAYIKDEIAGNGTSGVYRLSRGNLMINSDKIQIETRDRFQSQIIVAARFLTRYLDYNIDYDRGTLILREPVDVRDGSFNPNTIVVEYESADPFDKAATFGGRTSFRPGKNAEIGATLVHEGTVGASGNLRGLDARYQLGNNTRLRAEVAATQRHLAGINARGSAWLGEVQHHEEQWDAKAYVREQATDFGLGQQAASETGTRKMGADGRWKLSDTQQFQGQAYRLENLTTGVQSTVLEGRVDQRLGDDLSAYYGARGSQDTSVAGAAPGRQLIVGAAYTLLEKKLVLHGAAEIGAEATVGASMPDRMILGADYKLTEKTRWFAEKEFARDVQIASNATRVGLRTQAWTGGEVAGSVGNSIQNDAGRLYGNLGLVQRWKIDEHWQADFSLDRSQTLRSSATPTDPVIATVTPPALSAYLPTGSPSGDYTTATAGLAYQNGLWSADGRIEIRNADLDQQKNLQIGFQRQLVDGRSVAVGLVLRSASSATSSKHYGDLRLSYAYRPVESRWVWFGRADYISQSQAWTINGAKLVNNFNANYRPNPRSQLSLQYGAKYVIDAIDGIDYRGYTDLIGSEFRRDLCKDWDVGIFGSVLRSVTAGVRDYSVGASVGYQLMTNVWVALGYNLRGLDDHDFNGGNYSARGFYLTLRMKVDQDTLGLNRRNEDVHPKPREP